MSSLINTYAKGRFIEKCMLPLGTDHILVILLQSTGLPADTTLQNYANLGALVAAAQEANFSNYERISLSSSNIIISQNTASSPTTQSVSFTPAPMVINGAGGAVNNTLAKVALAYQPTAGTADSGCLVLATLDYSFPTTGGELDITLGTLTDD